MHNRTHPLGNNFPSITYRRVYDYLNCLEINPCWGWLNSNETIRNYTDGHAALLSGVYQEIINEFGNGTRWTNFDLYYWPLGFTDIINTWRAEGGQVWELIEPVDGFHPSQIGDTLLAKFHIDMVTKMAPELLPPINSNNALIQTQFGDQGGY